MMNTHKALSLHVSRFAQFGAWGMVLALLAACGSIPPPPSVPAFPAEEPNTKGIPSAAFTSFETGVKALEEKPANFIDAAKSFEEALNTYEASRNRQIKARENHKQELVQNEKALEAWKKLHGKKLAEEPDLKKQLAQILKIRRKNCQTSSASTQNSTGNPLHVKFNVSLCMYMH